MKFIYQYSLISFVSVLLFMGSNGLHSQTQYSDFKGTVYDAQAGAAVLMGSPLAIYTNPADLIYSPAFAISASAKNYFFGEDGVWAGILASSFSVGKNGGVGISLSSLGNSAAHAYTLSLAYAHQLGKDMGLGITLNGHQYSVAHYDNAISGSVDIGFRAAVYPYLHLEISIQNPYEIGRYDYKQSRSALIFQVLYEISKEVQWTTAFKKYWESPLSVNTAIAYEIVNNLHLYVGGGIAPVQFAMGISYSMGDFSLMTASRYRAPLGLSPSIQLGYKSD